MKRTVIATAILVFGTTLATAAYAQGRHDEKPHGSTKPSTSVTTGVPATGGRHDEGPHGPRKVSTKTSAAAADGSFKRAPDSDNCCK